MADTLQDVEIDSGNEQARQLQNDNKETKDDDPPRDTNDGSGLTKKDTDEDESKQMNGRMTTNNLASEVIVEEEVYEDSVETENTKPEKKVTLPDDVPTQGGHGNPDHASLLPDEINIAASGTKNTNDERHPSPNEVLTTFGKERTGMNSRKPGPSEIKSNESEKSPFEKVGQNGIPETEFEGQPNSLGPRDHTLTDIVI